MCAYKKYLNVFTIENLNQIEDVRIQKRFESLTSEVLYESGVRKYFLHVF
jgi:hypothetical protein